MIIIFWQTFNKIWLGLIRETIVFMSFPLFKTEIEKTTFIIHSNGDFYVGHIQYCSFVLFFPSFFSYFSWLFPKRQKIKKSKKKNIYERQQEIFASFIIFFLWRKEDEISKSFMQQTVLNIGDICEDKLFGIRPLIVTQ